MREAIRHIMRDGNYYLGYEAARLFNYMEDSNHTGRQLLTEKEIQLLIELCTGDSNKEICARMYVSPRTLQNMIETLQQKLKVENR